MQKPRSRTYPQAGRLNSGLWAWVELNYRPHAYQATEGEQEVRQEIFKSLTDSVICRCLTFRMPDNVGVNRQLNRQQSPPVIPPTLTRVGSFRCLRSPSGRWVVQKRPALLGRSIATSINPAALMPAGMSSVLFEAPRLRPPHIILEHVSPRHGDDRQREPEERLRHRFGG